MQKIKNTLTDLVAIACVSKQESKIRNYVQKRLDKLGIHSEIDEIGNLLAHLPGKGESILLNAHLDRVPPGKSVTSVFDGTILKTNGSTNLGADDAVGITIILETLEEIKAKKLNHPPIDLVFTVQEEIGLFGAKALDLKKIQAKSGIIFDNAFEAGVVVEQGSFYLAFDISIEGNSVHSGKNLASSVNALLPLLQSDIELGELDNGFTRVNIGKVEAGTMRNAVPDKVTILGEIRSFLEAKELEYRVSKTLSSFNKVAYKIGAKITQETFQIPGYSINPNNIHLKKYQKVLGKGKLLKKKTFVGSDANALRGIHGLDVFVISTGVVNEHTLDEFVDLKDVRHLTEVLVSILS